MSDVIHLTDEFYILATEATGDETRVLKQGESFGIFDRYGDIVHAGLGEQGIYHDGTRFLSRLAFSLGHVRPFLLSSTIKDNNFLLTVDLTNPDIYRDGHIVLRRGNLHISRTKLMWESACYECVKIANYGLSPVGISFSLQFEADFADIFEVRGIQRKRKGSRMESTVDSGRVLLAYEGLDGIIRRTRLEFSPPPEKINTAEASFHRLLAPKEEEVFWFTYSFASEVGPSARLSYPSALSHAEDAIRTYQTAECRIETSNGQFDGWLNRSFADLHMMLTETPHGIYPYAGVPWFSTPFGRDGIITALEFLWVNAGVAKGVLSYLAATQATEFIPEKDAEPGKILHEARGGEMAALGEIPFDRYYGSTDATPLFVMLAGSYYERTQDLELIQRIWPQIDLAVKWIDNYGDPDHDGFVETVRYSSGALIQQGWKDSWDSISHQNGDLAEGTIALCEVQCYTYAAKCAAARLASLMGQAERARDLLLQAELLKKRFNEVFWCEELSTFALALDGEKRPCRVKSSNAGHSLFTGIATDEHARRTAETLMSDESFSGWGIRTLGAGEVRYNPMSYHNGSVWPHDNGLIAAGFARYGYNDLTHKILAGLFEASLFMNFRSLPELFCGFRRRDGEGPTRYPVACSPQSWSAASAFLLLQACLGLSIDAAQSRVCLAHLSLPDFLDEVRIFDLKVGNASIDLVMGRSPRSIRIDRRQGDVHVMMIN